MIFKTPGHSQKLISEIEKKFNQISLISFFICYTKNDILDFHSMMLKCNSKLNNYLGWVLNLIFTEVPEPTVLDTETPYSSP